MYFKFRSKLLYSKTFIKMLISYILIIVVTILSISVILYFNFSKATIEDIQKNTREKLSQNINQLELIKNQVVSLGFQLLNDSNVTVALYSIESDDVNNYLTSMKLMQAVNVNPMISSIYVYDDKNKKFLSSLGLENYNTQEEQMKKIIHNYSNKKDKLKFITSTFTNKTRIGEDYKENIISMVFGDYLDADSDDYSKSMVIINLKADYIQKIFTKQYNSKDSDIILIDKDGKVISDSSFMYFSKNISNVDYIASILNSNKQSGFFTKKDSEGKYLVSYESLDSSPYIFINKINYSVLLAKNHTLATNITIICGAILIIGTIISILTSINVYLPFHKLTQSVRWKVTNDEEVKMNKNSYNDIEYLSNIFSNMIDKTNKLESSIVENSGFMKTMFLKDLLENNIKSSMNLYEKINELKLNIRTDNISVILFSIDEYSRFLKSEVKPFKKELVSEIESIINKVMTTDTNIPYELVYSGHGLITLIANNENEDEFNEIIKNRIMLIQEFVINTFSVTVTGVIGLTVENIEETYKAYENSLSILKYRFVYGYKSILVNNIIESKIDRKMTSIEKNKKKIIESIKECDADKLEANINNAFELIANCQYDFIRLTINQLVLDTISGVASLNTSLNNDVNFDNIYNNINDIDTMEGMKKWFISYCKSIIAKLLSRRDSKQSDMIKMVSSYIESNYYKPEISTEFVSDIVNLTPGYLGKIFSEYFGKSINEYITELRIKKAKELLEDSALTVNDIAAKVGYSNQSYFTSIFKKNLGITPNNYRTNYKKSVK